jgi:hypothetical protein
LLIIVDARRKPEWLTFARERHLGPLVSEDMEVAMSAKTLKGAVATTCAALSLLVVVTGAIAAPSVSLCISSKKGADVKSGECPSDTKTVTYTSVKLPAEPEAQQTLLSILPYIKYVASGVGSKPTIQFSGANVQILSGTGTEETLNGAGNLIVGYDPSPRAQTGSDNLIVGTEQEFTSYGSIVGGTDNTIEAPFSDVFGARNLVLGEDSSIIGGYQNAAYGSNSTIIGGQLNQTGKEVTGEGGGLATVAGGVENNAEGIASVIGGGSSNVATGTLSSASGGVANKATGDFSWMGGGSNNEAKGQNSSVTGGIYGTAEGLWSSVDGGFQDSATGKYSAILGGKVKSISTEYGVSP